MPLSLHSIYNIFTLILTQSTLLTYHFHSTMGELSTPTPTLADLLSKLHEYDTCHKQSCIELKTSFMNLTKARRHKGSGSVGAFNNFSAKDVREELRASTRVFTLDEDGNEIIGDDVPALLEDEDEEGEEEERAEDKGGCKLVTFRLIDANKELKKRREMKLNVVKKSDGVRQRKNSNSVKKDVDNSPEQPSSSWTKETFLNKFELEEQLLLESNPISLFGGFPPPSLKSAQINARKALEGYIKAATLKASLINMMNKRDKRK